MPKPASTKQLVLINIVVSVIGAWQWQPASALPSKSATTPAPVKEKNGVPSYRQLPNPVAPKQWPQEKQIISDLSAALRQNPNDVKILLQRADCYLRLRDWPHAAQDCDQAFKLKPDSREAGDMAYKLVQAYNIDLDEENALHFSDLTIRAFPNQSRLYSERGELLHGMGRDKDGIADETKAIALNPKNGNAHFARGEIKAATGDMSGAIVDFDNAALYLKNPFVAFLRCGQCHEVLKDWKNAAITYGKILPLKISDLADRLKARVHRASCLMEMGDKEGALKEFTIVIETPSTRTMKFEKSTQANEQSEALHGRAQIYAIQKKYDLAIKDYTRLIGHEEEWGEHTPKWYQERAKLYRQIGKIDLARSDEGIAKKMATPKQ